MDINNTSVMEDLIAEFGSQKEQDIPGRAAEPVLGGAMLGASERVCTTEVCTSEPSEKAFPRLFNATDASHINQREKYEHRLIALLKATGMSNTEIAKETGYTPVMVGYIVKQPWAVDLILSRIHGSSDAAMKALQDASLAAAMRLIEIAETAKNEEVKRKANNDILDRKYGKPNQPYTLATKGAHEMSDDELAKAVQSGNN